MIQFRIKSDKAIGFAIIDVKEGEKDDLKGYIYNAEGLFLEHIEGSDNVFLAEKYTENISESSKNKYEYSTELKDLQITHTNFIYIAGVLVKEDSSSFEAAAAVVQTTFNAVKLRKGDSLTIKKQAEYAAKLLKTAYSSVTNKVNLEDDDVKSNAKNMRKGLIHVLQGKLDYSDGAILWDGIDFADKGPLHNKATKDGGISISKKMWDDFVDVCSFDKDDKLQYGKRETKEVVKEKFPFGQEIETVKLTFANVYNVTDSLYESLGTGKYNKDRILYKASVVKGKQIYWAVNEDHEKNKNYEFKFLITDF